MPYHGCFDRHHERIFIEILGVVPFVATLATQWVYRGMANVLVNGAPVYTTNIPSEAVQKQFYILGGGRIGGDGLPYSVIITLIYAAILGVVLAKTRIGRQIYACGSNLEAAKLSGINAVKRVCCVLHFWFVGSDLRYSRCFQTFQCTADSRKRLRDGGYSSIRFRRYFDSGR